VFVMRYERHLRKKSKSAPRSRPWRAIRDSYEVRAVEVCRVVRRR
jgi:hypothetical protein